MLFVIVALFAFCWLPYQLYNLLREVFPQIDRYKYINIIWFVMHWLAMSNSCYNPFIYAIYNERFKREFALRCHCGGQRYKQTSRFAAYEQDDNNSTIIVSMRHSFRLSFKGSHSPIKGSSKL